MKDAHRRLPRCVLPIYAVNHETITVNRVGREFVRGCHSPAGALSLMLIGLLGSRWESDDFLLELQSLVSQHSQLGSLSDTFAHHAASLLRDAQPLMIDAVPLCMVLDQLGAEPHTHAGQMVKDRMGTLVSEDVLFPLKIPNLDSAEGRTRSFRVAS